MDKHHKTASLKQTASAPLGSNGDSGRIAKLETEVAVILTKFEQMPTKDDLHSEIDKVKVIINENFIRSNDNLHSEIDKVKVIINENFKHANENFKHVNDNLHSETHALRSEIHELRDTIDKKLWKHTGFLFFSISLAVSVLDFFLKS